MGLHAHPLLRRSEHLVINYFLCWFYALNDLSDYFFLGNLSLKLVNFMLVHNLLRNKPPSNHLNLLSVPACLGLHGLSRRLGMLSLLVQLQFELILLPNNVPAQVSFSCESISALTILNQVFNCVLAELVEE